MINIAYTLPGIAIATTDFNAYKNADALDYTLNRLKKTSTRRNYFSSTALKIRLKLAFLINALHKLGDDRTFTPIPLHQDFHQRNPRSQT